jgi:hypothetical protein
MISAVQYDISCTIYQLYILSAVHYYISCTVWNQLYILISVVQYISLHYDISGTFYQLCTTIPAVQYTYISSILYQLYYHTTSIVEHPIFVHQNTVLAQCSDARTDVLKKADITGQSRCRVSNYNSTLETIILLLLVSFFSGCTDIIFTMNGNETHSHGCVQPWLLYWEFKQTWIFLGASSQNTNYPITVVKLRCSIHRQRQR